MINLRNGYWIKAESIGYSLNREVKPGRAPNGPEPDPAKTVTKTIGFFGTLESCLSRYIDECVHDAVGQTEIDNILYLRGVILAAKEEIKKHI